MQYISTVCAGGLLYHIGLVPFPCSTRLLFCTVYLSLRFYVLCPPPSIFPPNYFQPDFPYVAPASLDLAVSAFSEKLRLQTPVHADADHILVLGAVSDQWCLLLRDHTAVWEGAGWRRAVRHDGANVFRVR